jgi:hypothetical protein
MCSEAAAAGIERKVRVLQITVEIVSDVKIALVNRRNERQQVHVFQNRALVIVHNDARRIAVRQSDDVAQRFAVRNILDCKVELIAADKIDQR